MSVSVGYIQAGWDQAQVAAQTERLLAGGCQTVRVEAAGRPDSLLKPVLSGVCEFLGPGDELVAPDLTHLGPSPGAAAALIGRLDLKGSWIRLLDLDLVGADPGLAPGAMTRRDRAAAASRRKPAIDAHAVRQLRSRGLGPTQIARNLGVSRMTVWRKLTSELSA